MMSKYTGFVHKDTFLRVNYLFQAAFTVLSENPKNLGLVRYYVHTLRSVAEKNTLRLDPSIKRQICKRCSMILVPGITATVRTKAKSCPHTVVTCIECRTQKRFVQSKHHKLWSETPSAWLAGTPKHLIQECSGGSEEFNIVTHEKQRTFDEQKTVHLPGSTSNV